MCEQISQFSMSWMSQHCQRSDINRPGKRDVNDCHTPQHTFSLSFSHSLSEVLSISISLQVMARLNREQKPSVGVIWHMLPWLFHPYAASVTGLRAEDTLAVLSSLLVSHLYFLLLYLPTLRHLPLPEF